MKRVLMGLMLLSSLLLSNVSYAGYAEGTPFSSGNTNTTPAPDAYGQIVRIVGGSKCKVTAAPPSYSEGDEVPLSCELDGDLRTNATGGGGSGDASLAEQQTQTGILTTIDSDTGTIAGAVKAEDAAHSSGHTGIPFWGVRNDSASTSLSDTNGDYTPIATDSNGRLFINAISSIFSVTPGTGSTNLGKAEDVAHASGDTGVAVWARRIDTPATSGGTDGDYVTFNSDAAGYLYVMPRSSGSTGAAPPDRASYSAGLGSGATGGFLTGIPVADSFVNVNVSTATTTLLITGVAGRHVRISSISLVTATANNVALISGTGATCGTGTTGMNGGTTAASGWNFAANGGITQGSGLGTINQTNATGDSVCIVTSAATQLSGRIAYTIY